jgi:D-alanine-D-alanine ligase-like ATP-grasp enzyme/L-alanine-DL-glutamate epimerase-like enolase superfamily enzyme/acylphosphatase
MSRMQLSSSLTPKDSGPPQRVTDTDASSLHITQAQAYSYRVPQTKFSAHRSINFIVRLKATTSDGRHIEGLGEGQPRSWRTGDDAGNSWKYLAEAVGQLCDELICTDGSSQALDAVRAYMESFTQLAHDHSSKLGHPHPFRGTMLGIEIALLDLVAKARNETLAKLLGQKRQSAPKFTGAISASIDRKTLRRSLRREADAYEYVRLTGVSDTAKNLHFLEQVAKINGGSRIGLPNKPLWLDLNGLLAPQQASDFVKAVVDAAVRYTLPSKVLIEQPVPAKAGCHLVALQRQANEAVKDSGREGLQISIVGDESVFDVQDMADMQGSGGIRGVNIRPAQAGGLLASIELAAKALENEPEAKIFLTRMAGASRITASALLHLALALPQVDGAVVSSVVEKTMRLSNQVESEGTTDEAQQDLKPAPAVERGEEATLANAGKTSVTPVQIIRSSGDDEPESDGLKDGGDDDPRSIADISVDSRLDEENVEAIDTSTDDAEDSTIDPIRRFGVRNSPGIGIELRFAGLVGDVREAVTYPAPPETTYNGIPVSRYEDVDDLHPLGANGSKGHLLEREALALGLDTTRYSKGAFTVTDGQSNPVPFKWSRNPLSSASALALCTHKEATRMQLQQAGVPVPQGRTFARGDYATAKEFVDRIGYPVVVKPTMGVRGIGVVAGIQDERQLEGALNLMSGSRLGDQDFIVEKHVRGADYRIVVIGDEVIAAIQREPASVFGDGKSTIGELLIAKNIARKRNPHLWARPAKYDDAARHELLMAGRNLETVLQKGERQLLANTCSLSQGGDSIDVLDEMHPSIKEASVKAVKAIPGLYFCGVDFLLEDHTKPVTEQDAGICELNAHAAIGNCEYPMFGTGRPVAQTLMRASVDHFGLSARRDRAEQVALHLTIRGRVTAVGFRKWLQRRALISGVSGWVRNVNRRTVEAVLVGPTDPTTAVAAATVLGPRRAVPTAYEAKHISFPERMDGFEIREDAPEGMPVVAVDAA